MPENCAAKESPTPLEHGFLCTPLPAEAGSAVWALSFAAKL
jgi:hypothetical protein